MAPPSLEPGTSFAGHRIVLMLGEGRSGASYLALDAMDRYVVLRVFTATPESRYGRALLREQRHVAELYAPGVPPVLDVGAVGDHVYVVRAFVRGTPLLARPGSEPRRARQLLAVADALVEAGAFGVVHGSLRSDNVLVDDDGRVHLVDLGLLNTTSPRRPLLPLGPRGPRFSERERHQLAEEVARAREDARAGRPPGAAARALDVFTLGLLAARCLDRDSASADLLRPALDPDPHRRVSIFEVQQRLQAAVALSGPEDATEADRIRETPTSEWRPLPPERGVFRSPEEPADAEPAEPAEAAADADTPPPWDAIAGDDVEDDDAPRPAAPAPPRVPAPPPPGGPPPGGRPPARRPPAMPSPAPAMPSPAPADGPPGRGGWAGRGRVGRTARPRPRRSLPRWSVPERLRGRTADAGRPPTVVNTGFEALAEPGRRLPKRRALKAEQAYAFTLDVGRPDRTAIDDRAEPLVTDGLKAGTELAVTVHAVGGDVTMGRDATMGMLVVNGDGGISAPRTPDGRLRFPLRTGAPGTIRLRASIHHGPIVLQSRLITAEVGSSGLARIFGLPRRRLRAVVDYAIAASLTPEAIAPLGDAADVSLMLNGDADTHALQVCAADAQGALHSSGATFDAATLQRSVELARGVLRQVAWGKEAPWQKGDEYRYNTPVAPEDLRRDLCRLAIRGWRLYDECVNELADVSGDTFDDFEQLMRRPRRIQLASSRDARLLLPVALFYDTPLDTSVPLDDLTLCDAYTRPSVATSPCLQGDCPHHDDDTVVCPSGFWGFRHVIGLPLSLRPGRDGEQRHAATTITYNNHPAFGMAVSTDPLFELRAEHEAALQAMVDPSRWRYADTLSTTMALLKATDNHLIYFYCHGGISKGMPYLQVGGTAERGITADLIRSKRIRWNDPSRPLVFINGCHTTALEPSQLFDFVSKLIENASAAGVVGTEITNFEPLAGSFATACLRRFLAGEPLGDAIRAARLELLEQGNPLGLIYTPFAMPTLRLVSGATPVAAARG